MKVSDNKNTEQTVCTAPERKLQSLRVVSYIVGGAVTDSAYERFDMGHLDVLTDVIFFYHGSTRFDRYGNVSITQSGLDALGRMKMLIGDRPIRLHIFMQGPEVVWGGLDVEHKAAFESGVLESNIRKFLETYQLDGVNFDYEFPDTEEDYENFSKFIVSLKRTLGDDFILSSALNASHANYSKACIEAFDTVELMSYDYYDENGDHATLDLTKEHVETVLAMGYPPEKINLGLPYYARPSDQSAYWYDWGEYYDKVDNSKYYHCPKTGKRFYFNDESLIYQKTAYAIENSLGGMMIWHYSSDAPSDSGHSLFTAIQCAKDDAGIK